MFEVTRRVEFRETDAGGVAHFSVYFGYMEEAEHALWRNLGTSVVRFEDDSVLSWPRVSARCDYRSPLRFEDVVTIRVAVKRIGESSVTFTFQFQLDEKLVAEGELTTVYCEFSPPGRLEKRSIPPRLRYRLQSHLAMPSHSDAQESGNAGDRHE